MEEKEKSVPTPKGVTGITPTERFVYVNEFDETTDDLLRDLKYEKIPEKHYKAAEKFFIDEKIPLSDISHTLKFWKKFVPEDYDINGHTFREVLGIIKECKLKSRDKDRIFLEEFIELCKRHNRGLMAEDGNICLTVIPFDEVKDVHSDPESFFEYDWEYENFKDLEERYSK